MLKEDADTPLKRVYYIAQLAMAGEADPHLASEQILEGLKPLKSIFFGEAGEDIIRAGDAARDGKFFVVMRAVKRQFEFELALLERASAAAPATAIAS